MGISFGWVGALVLILSGLVAGLTSSTCALFFFEVLRVTLSGSLSTSDSGFSATGSVSEGVDVFSSSCSSLTISAVCVCSCESRLVFPPQLHDLPLTFSDASFGDDYLLPPFDPAVFLQKW